jgi:hypothetical protein
MLQCLIGSTCIIRWGNKISADAESAQAAAPTAAVTK